MACRYCFESTYEPLIRPCKCTERVHFTCLTEWRMRRIDDSTTCSECSTRYYLPDIRTQIAVSRLLAPILWFLLYNIINGIYDSVITAIGLLFSSCGLILSAANDPWRFGNLINLLTTILCTAYSIDDDTLICTEWNYLKFQNSYFGQFIYIWTLNMGMVILVQYT